MAFPTLTPGEWYEVASSNLDALEPGPPVTGGAIAGIMAWSGGAFDTLRDRLLVFGGGHGDYAGNEVYAFDVDTLTWARIIGPTANSGIHQNVEAYDDSTPASRHTYGGLAYVEALDKFFVTGGILWGNPPAGSRGSWLLDLATLVWTREDDIPGTGSMRTSTAYDPLTEHIFFRGVEGAGGGTEHFAEYSPSTGSFTERGTPQGASTGPNPSAAIDPVRRLFVMAGTFVIRVWNLDSPYNYYEPTITGDPFPGDDTEGPGFVYDPVRETFIGWFEGSSLWELTPGTDPENDAWVWAELAAAPTNTVTPSDGPYFGPFGRFQYIPSQNAYILYNGVTENVYLYRISDSVPSGLNIGTLVQDGPDTPEQISLKLPITGSLDAAATATMRYKVTGAGSWTTGHPLYRIQPSFSNTPANGSVDDAFAWPIIDLTPGTSYDIEVTVDDGIIDPEVQTLTVSTRALPAASGTATYTITAGASQSTIEAAIAALSHGDVLEFQDGIYSLDGAMTIDIAGTAMAPIYIRGQSRSGTILHAPSLYVIRLLDAHYIVFERMTWQGSGVDDTPAASSVGLGFYDGTPNQTGITIRNITITGVDKGVECYDNISSFLAYNNTLIGNNLWNSTFIDSDITWNDDGIQVPGFGNAVFNNTIRGFGDSLSYAAHSGDDTLTQSVGVHFYRNYIRNSGDDMAEVDHSHRNITLYDNLSLNSMTFISLDPLYGGPFLAARNIAINIGRSPLKFNDLNTGMFLYNNTIIRTNGAGVHTDWGELQFNDGAQQSWGFENNLFIYRGTGNPWVWETNGNDPIDFTHNSWYPDGTFQWSNTGGTFTDLADAQADIPATEPVFSGEILRHTDDNITVSNPWTVTVTLGSDYLTEITIAYAPALSGGDAAKNSGIAIIGVTDGFSGAAPDRGAIIEGRTVPLFGDQSPEDSVVVKKLTAFRSKIS